MSEPLVPSVQYTELPDLPPDHPLAQEWATYKRELPRLLAEGHEGRFVLICNNTLFCPFEEAWQAQLAGFVQYERTPFLVQQIRAWEPMDWQQILWGGGERALPVIKRTPGRSMPGLPTIDSREVPDLPPDHVLAEEARTFQRELPRLLADGQEGRFALLKGDAVIGIFDNLWAAADAGRKKFGFAPFLVKQIQERDRILRQRMV